MAGWLNADNKGKYMIGTRYLILRYDCNKERSTLEPQVTTPRITKLFRDRCLIIFIHNTYIHKSLRAQREARPLEALKFETHY